MCGHAFLCPCDWFAFATCGNHVSPCHAMGMDMNAVADCLDYAIESSAHSLRA